MREQNEQLEEVVCEEKEIGLRCVIVHVCVLKSERERERERGRFSLQRTSSPMG